LFSLALSCSLSRSLSLSRAFLFSLALSFSLSRFLVLSRALLFSPALSCSLSRSHIYIYIFPVSRVANKNGACVRARTAAATTTTTTGAERRTTNNEQQQGLFTHIKACNQRCMHVRVHVASCLRCHCDGVSDLHGSGRRHHSSI